MTAGAKRVIALVTHGPFMPGAAEVIADPAIEHFIVSDTIPPFRLEGSAAAGKIDTVAAAPLIVEAIGRHQGEALTDLLVF